MGMDLIQDNVFVGPSVTFCINDISRLQKKSIQTAVPTEI